ncbi:MAG TPA: response regulator [Bryobacteraceae bacterium]|nr:response regulator [Bryobacteraceae bacterium]
MAKPSSADPLTVALIDDMPLALRLDSGESPKAKTVALAPPAFATLDVGSLDDWVSTTVVPWLAEIRPVPRLLFINANLKFWAEDLRTNWSGVLLASHIRYTKTLYDPVRYAHIVLYSFAPDRLDAATVMERLVAYSPGVTFLRAPLPRFSGRALQRFAARRIGRVEARSSVLAMEIAPGETSETYAHSWRNRLGVSKFLQEFAPDIFTRDHLLSADARSQNTIDVKRAMFLHPELLPAETLKSTESASLRKECRGHTFLQIDDEHDRGWSMVLTAGLTGVKPNAKHGSVYAIKTAAEGLDLIRDRKALWDSALARLETALAESERYNAESLVDQASRDLDAAWPWSAVFLDLRLEPKDEARKPNQLSGWRIFDELRKHFPHVAVCILTASQRAINAEKAYLGGAVDYWVKGVSTGREMQDAVRECIRRASLASLRRDLCRIERIPAIRCRKYEDGFWSDLLRSRDDDGRIVLQELLESCFWAFWHATSHKLHERIENDIWKNVLLKLGIVHTIRFSIDTRQLSSHEARAALGQELDSTNIDLRRLRNWLAHGGPKPWDCPEPDEELAKTMFIETVTSLWKGRRL